MTTPLPPRDLHGMIVDLKNGVATCRDHIKFGELLIIVGERAYAAMLVLPALLSASPLTAIPGLSFFMALLIIFVSSQMLFRRKTLWLPYKLRNMEFKKSKTLNALGRMERPAQILDKIMKPRLLMLTGNFGESFILLLSLILAIVSIPAMMIPLSNLVLCAAILFFAMGLMAKDGIVILIGLAIALAPFGALMYFTLPA